ncbi:MAG: hypothetical protein RLN69_09075 [Woeseiaceae bacterium]
MPLFLKELIIDCSGEHYRAIAYIGLKLQQRIPRLQKKRECPVLSKMLNLTVRMLELSRERGRLSVGVAAKITGAIHNTIKECMKSLTGVNHLNKHGAGRGAWSSLDTK